MERLGYGPTLSHPCPDPRSKINCRVNTTHARTLRRPITKAGGDI